MANIQQLCTDLQNDEGFKSCVYQDSLGYWTIGYGICVDIRIGGGITTQEGIYLLNNRITALLPQLSGQISCWDQLNDVRQNVLLNMAFQMGLTKLMKFVEMMAALEAGDYMEAAAEMLNSEWATETPVRAKKLAAQMQKGIISSP